ncbi:hypothetical protein Tco_0846355 [Tanacetum coccineum]
MECLPGRRWSTLEKKRANIMIKAIDKHVKKRRMMWSLKKFVGGSQNWRDLPRDIPLDSVEVLSYEVSVSAEGVEELKRKVKINGEKKEALLTLRQKLDDPSDTYVFTVKMEILLEPTSNKLLVGDL